MPCPRCGAASRPDDRFCENCGSALPDPGLVQSPADSVAATAAQPAGSSAPPPPPQQLTAIPTGGFTIDDVVAWLQSAGYSARIVTGESGNPHVQSSTQGTPFHVFMGDCQGPRCASIRFAAGFSTSGKFDISKMNDWNRDSRWCRGYFDSVNDPWLEMDVDLYPGGTYESLNDQFGAWNNTLASFIKTYNLR